MTKYPESRADQVVPDLRSANRRSRHLVGVTASVPLPS